MRESKISILNEFNERLIGIESVPSTEQESYPAIVLVHGFGVTKEEGGMFDDIARHLAEANFLVYRFDFSGCGESEGDYSETSLSKLSADLSNILEFVKSKEKVKWVGILAQSMGTSTTITLEPEVRCMLLMGAIAHLKELLISLFGSGYNPNGISTRVKPDGRVIELKPQVWKDFDNHHLLESIKRIHCPILFIHGSKDATIPPSEMEAYFENANEPKEKLLLEGADHSLRPKREELYLAVVEWFTGFR